MRPRQSSLGIKQTTGRDLLQGDGFNEAEAIKPRNQAEASNKTEPINRFNEAEAIKPRNLHGVSLQVGACVYGFNEAEAIKPRNHARAVATSLWQ